MQQLNPSEISDIIRQRIEQLDVSSASPTNEGTIVSRSRWHRIRSTALAEVQCTGK